MAINDFTMHRIILKFLRKKIQADKKNNETKRRLSERRDFPYDIFTNLLHSLNDINSLHCFNDSLCATSCVVFSAQIVS